ncbi:MAG: NUDIX hydrolase [Oscillospiraceae bacterium]|nr:NUDIX hydrolase [Oscillospiraceae bacterium]MBQ4538313.1 NUDIX hydrolase [Oscillospiraceae bacterium]
MPLSIEIKVDSKEVFSGKLLHVTSDSVLLENGKQAVREIIHHNGAAAVIAFDENNRLLMVRQYRYAIGQELLEIPAGKIDPGETPEQCAARELVEETGYRAGKLTELGVVYPIAAYSSEAQYLFYAENLTPDKQHLDEDEFLSVEHVDFATAFDMVMNGEITDSKTQIGILKINNIRQELV